jgi:hypothetical protein
MKRKDTGYQKRKCVRDEELLSSNQRPSPRGRYTKHPVAMKPIYGAMVLMADLCNFSSMVMTNSFLH